MFHTRRIPNSSVYFTRRLEFFPSNFICSSKFTHKSYARASTSTTETPNSNKRSKLIPLVQIPKDELGTSILHLEENGSGWTVLDRQRRIIKIAKVTTNLIN